MLMEFLLRSSIILLFAVVYRFAINSYRLKKMQTYLLEHRAFLLALSNKSPNTKEYIKKVPEIKALIETANVGDEVLSWMEPAGLGFAQQKQVSILDNIAANNQEIQFRVLNAFHRAEGTFEKRRKEAYNLFFWTEAIIYLPSKILVYLGVPKNNLFGRIANVISWFLGALGFMLALPDFTDWQKAVSQFLLKLVHLS